MFTDLNNSKLHFMLSMVIQRIPTCLNIQEALESATRNTILKVSLGFSWYNAFPKIQPLFNLILHFE